MEVEFLATIAAITPDPPASAALYAGALGLPLEGEQADGYRSTGALDGCKHFGVWPLSQVAEACFASKDWPAGRPVPQASIEFDVRSPDAVSAAAEELERSGFELLHPAREEPWGQTVARLQAPEGLIVGITHTPALREQP
jgi:catechol 2,3-dioxygenase-like lactoylglutathione lyase family enzyme